MQNSKLFYKREWQVWGTVRSWMMLDGWVVESAKGWGEILKGCRSGSQRGYWGTDCEALIFKVVDFILEVLESQRRVLF